MGEGIYNVVVQQQDINMSLLIPTTMLDLQEKQKPYFISVNSLIVQTAKCMTSAETLHKIFDSPLPNHL